MEPIIVTHPDPGNPLSVTVSEATALQGITRTVLITEAMDTLGERPAKKKKKTGKAKKPKLPEGEEWALFLLQRYTWPACKAAAIASDGFDHSTLTFDEFCRLPERFVQAWEKAVLRLNPHWRLITEEDAASEKKDVGASNSESTESS